MFGGGVPPEKVWIDHIDVAALVQLLRDFVEEFLTHDVIGELLGSRNIECESFHSTGNFTLTGLVAKDF